MDRRTFLKYGAAGAATAAASGCTQAVDNGQTENGETTASSPAVTTRSKRELSMVTTWPENFPGLGDMATRTADMIARLTEGQITVKVYAAGELVPAFEAFDAVSTGAADMYHAADYYWQGKAKGFPFFTAVPMGLTADEMLAWLQFGGGQELYEDLAAQFNLICFPAGNTGHQMGGWFKREINSLDDFNGLNMRIPGLGGDVLRGLGGAPVNLPGGKIYQSLQTGKIDATEWVGPWNDLAFGFYRVAPYYYGPGFHEPSAMMSCGINLDVWESLTEENRQAIRAACAWATNISIAQFNHQNAIALDTLINQHKVQLRSFNDEIWRAVQSVSADVVSGIGNSDATTKAIYESYMTARQRSLRWSAVSEGPYLRKRLLGTEFEPGAQARRQQGQDPAPTQPAEASNPPPEE